MILMQHLPIATTSPPSHVKDTLNIQAITVWTSKEKLIIEPNYQKTVIPTCLHITRQTGQLQQLPFKQDPRRQQSFTAHYFSAFLGILNLNNKKIIVLVEKVSLVMSIDQRDVFKVIKPVYLFYISQQRKRLTEEQSMILINLTMILQQGMYFSYAYNLNQPLNRLRREEQEQQGEEQQQEKQQQQQQDEDFSDHYDSQNSNKNNSKLNFNWANELQRQLLKFNSTWRLALIQGYVDKLQMIINGLKIFIFLISRRCISRSGTLYSQQGRGIDSNGYTANFVQTQLILNVNSYFFSYLQHRGNVPIYWYQQQSYGGMNKTVKFFHSVQQNNSAFLKHLKLVKERNGFQYVGLVNLLNENSSLEKGLVNNYQYLVQKNFDNNQYELNTNNNSASQTNNNTTTTPNIKKSLTPYLLTHSPLQPSHVNYAYFNIHSQCSKKNYRPLLSFIQTDLQKLLHQYEFTILKIDHHERKKQVLNTQKGIFRINCMNCIDRSNIAQLSIGAYMIAFMLKHIQIEIPQFEQGMSFILNDDDSFTNLYRELWADNADALSKQYTGTGSTQSFAVRKGKLSYLTTIDHGMKSLARAIKNIRNPDQIKNKAIRLLTGYKQPQIKTTKNKNDLKEVQMKQIKQRTFAILAKDHNNVLTTSEKSPLIDNYEYQKQQKINQITKKYENQESKIMDLEFLQQVQLSSFKSGKEVAEHHQRSYTFT